MSRIGKLPILIPEGVEVTIEDIDNIQSITAKGKLGQLGYSLKEGINVSKEDKSLSVSRKDDTKELKALHGLTRMLVANIVQGVATGFNKELHVVGTGYSAEVKGKWLKLVLGYSHDILLEIPEHIDVQTEAVPRGRGKKVDTQAIIRLKGISKQEVGNFAAEIRKCRPPENYKGKGIRYSDEIVHLKAGKTGA